MKTRLTKEQSDHLLSLGCTFPNNLAIQDNNKDFYVRIELADLLEILPKELMFDKEHGLDFGWDFYENKWFARYSDEDSICVYENAWYLDKELIDALYQLACWYYGEYLKSEGK